jgi:hypothetical protein
MRTSTEIVFALYLSGPQNVYVQSTKNGFGRQLTGGMGDPSFESTVGRCRKIVRMQRGWAKLPLRPELRREYDHAFGQDLVWSVGTGDLSPHTLRCPSKISLRVHPITQYIFCSSILILDYDTSGAEGSWTI